MKGLIRNNLYSMENSILIAFIISIFLAIVPFGGVNPTLLPMIISIQIFVFVVNIGTSLRADETAKWSKFELTLPIKRSNLVLAKYVSIIILILMGIVMGTATMVLSSYYDHAVSHSALIYGFEYGLTLSIFSTSIMYPPDSHIGSDIAKSALSAVLDCGIMIARHIKVLSVMERSMAKCQIKDGTAKTAFCGPERAKEKTGDMRTNTSTRWETRSLFMRGS